MNAEFTPIVSIRLMCYNQEKYIAKAMDSIMMQDVNFPVEVVVGDDFSTDNTLSIIKSYNDSEFIKIKILDRKVGDEYWIMRQKYGRLYNYLNILQNCSGKFIALLDGDDFWVDQEKLKKQVQYFEKFPNCSINSHEVYILNYKAKNTFKSALRIVYDNFSLTSISSIKMMLISMILLKNTFWNHRIGYNNIKRFNNYTFENILKDGHFMATSSIMIRREVVDLLDLWYTNSDGGHYFIVLIALTVGDGFHFKTVMGVHNLNPGSISLNVVRKQKLINKSTEDQLFKLNILKDCAPEFEAAINYQIDKVKKNANGKVVK